MSARKDVPRCLSVPPAGYSKIASKTHDVSRNVPKLWLFSNKTTPFIWLRSARKDVLRCLSVPCGGYSKSASKLNDVSRKVKKRL